MGIPCAWVVERQRSLRERADRVERWRVLVSLIGKRRRRAL